MDNLDTGKYIGNIGKKTWNKDQKKKTNKQTKKTVTQHRNQNKISNTCFMKNLRVTLSAHEG